MAAAPAPPAPGIVGDAPPPRFRPPLGPAFRPDDLGGGYSTPEEPAAAVATPVGPPRAAPAPRPAAAAVETPSGFSPEPVADPARAAELARAGVVRPAPVPGAQPPAAEAGAAVQARLDGPDARGREVVEPEVPLGIPGVPRPGTPPRPGQPTVPRPQPLPPSATGMPVQPQRRLEHELPREGSGRRAIPPPLRAAPQGPGPDAGAPPRGPRPGGPGAGRPGAPGGAPGRGGQAGAPGAGRPGGGPGGGYAGGPGGAPRGGPVVGPAAPVASLARAAVPVALPAPPVVDAPALVPLAVPPAARRARRAAPVAATRSARTSSGVPDAAGAASAAPSRRRSPARSTCCRAPRSRELAKAIGVNPTDVVGVLFRMGELATVTQSLSQDMIELVAAEMEAEIRFVTPEELEFGVEEQEDPAALRPRAPVVTVMGHVDHGKTLLLDTIRQSDVVSGEAGGITQHIGAYQVQRDGREITFIDTPGHEAFTAMRARGAGVTDVVILVVAADDGVKPQTVEAINHAKAAEVPIIVAVNKIDKEGADPVRVRTQLTEYDLVAEEFGGQTTFVDVSAKTGQHIEDLLEMVLLQADVTELTANPDRDARGTVIEANLDRGRGAVATVLVQQGTLHIGDVLVAGTADGKVRAMFDDDGKTVKVAGPSTPVRGPGLDRRPRRRRRVPGGRRRAHRPRHRRQPRRARAPHGDRLAAPLHARGPLPGGRRGRAADAQPRHQGRRGRHGRGRRRRDGQARHRGCPHRASSTRASAR